MDQQKYEKLLNIKTQGAQKEFYRSIHYHRYEPTSYHVFETLFQEFNIYENDNLIDFGCGKGRLNFYANHFFNVNAKGIEMNSFYIDECNHNKKSYFEKHNNKESKIEFFNSHAEKYKVEKDDNIFYFFNPFSVQIFSKVLKNILKSYEKFPRKITLLLYYPSDDYIYYLENDSPFTLDKEVCIYPEYKKNDREKVSIYTFG